MSNYNTFNDAVEQRFANDAKIERLAAQFVADWLTEHGLDYVRVQDDAETPSYALMENDPYNENGDEQLDHAIGWLPKSVISNPTPPGEIYENGKLVGYTRPGWNPVVTLADLNTYLTQP